MASSAQSVDRLERTALTPTAVRVKQAVTGIFGPADIDVLHPFCNSPPSCRSGMN